MTPWKATLVQAPGRTCGSVEREALAGAGLMTGLVTLWGHTGAVYSEELHPLEVTHTGPRFELELPKYSPDTQIPNLNPDIISLSNMFGFSRRTFLVPSILDGPLLVSRGLFRHKLKG